MNNIESLNSICESVKFAISVSDELTEENRKHIDECEDCRAFYEQSKLMSEHLAGLRSDFDKQELGVADAVMKEINSQKAFAFGSSFTNRHIFKHAGLVAACLIVVVMVIPIMNANMAKSADEAAIENRSAVIEDGAIEDAVDEESYNYAYDLKVADVSDKSMYNLYSITTTDSFETTNGSVAYETAEEEAGVKMGTMFDVDNTDAPAEIAQAESESEVLEEGTDVTLVVSDIVSANGLDIETANFFYLSTETLYLEFTNDDSEIIFIIELVFKNGKWNIVSTTDMRNSIG